jgi:polyphosphate kinase 2 (PPK2 family)
VGDGAGKGETVNLLNEWMDPRHIVTYAFGPPSDEETARPPM